VRALTFGIDYVHLPCTGHFSASSHCQYLPIIICRNVHAGRSRGTGFPKLGWDINMDALQSFCLLCASARMALWYNAVIRPTFHWSLRTVYQTRTRSGPGCSWTLGLGPPNSPLPFGCICFVVLVMRKGVENGWSGPWHLGCTSEVFHVHSYQDQFIQPGWSECFVYLA